MEKKKTCIKPAPGVRAAITTAVLLSALVAGSLMLQPPAPATAAGPPPEQSGPAMGKGHRFGKMAEVLGLSAEQQDKLRAIRQADQGKMEQLHKDLVAGREKLRTATEAAPFDEAAVRSLAASQAATHIEMVVIRARQHNQIQALLTPEQREKAAKLRSERQQRRGPGLRQSPPPDGDEPDDQDL